MAKKVVPIVKKFTSTAPPPAKVGYEDGLLITIGLIEIKIVHDHFDEPLFRVHVWHNADPIVDFMWVYLGSIRGVNVYNGVDFAIQDCQFEVDFQGEDRRWRVGFGYDKAERLGLVKVWGRNVPGAASVLLDYEYREVD